MCLPADKIISYSEKPLRETMERGTVPLCPRPGEKKRKREGKRIRAIGAGRESREEIHRETARRAYAICVIK
jgi:hypothetical protein